MGSSPSNRRRGGERSRRASFRRSRLPRRKRRSRRCSVPCRW